MWWDHGVIDPPVLSSVTLRRSGPQARLLVLLHGYGEPAEQLTDRLDLIDPDGHYLVVVPNAPFERRGLAIWHRAMTARDESEVQFVASMAALDAHLGELQRTTGLPATEAVVGGFSQGGGMALGVLMGQGVVHRPAAGFGVCSFPPSVRGFRVDPAVAGRPYFLSTARQDRFAPIESCRMGAAALVAQGMDLTYVESEGEHVMTDEAAAQVGTWLASLDGGPPLPTADLLAGIDGSTGGFADVWAEPALEGNPWPYPESVAPS